MLREICAGLAAAIFIGTPSVVHAQACLGVPSMDGQVALEGSVTFTEGAQGYGGGVYANFRGPISLFGAYELTNFDDIEQNANSFGAGVAFELSVPSISICPGAGVNYTRIHEEEAGEEATVSQIVVPIGVGIGKRITAGDNFFVTLYGQPQFLYIRTSLDIDSSIGSGSASESENEFGMVLGIRFGTAGVYAGGGVGLTTIEDSDPVFTVNVGVMLGKR